MSRCARQTSQAMQLREIEVGAVLAEAGELWGAADSNHDGLLDYHEWKPAAFSLASIFVDVFLDIFDIDRDGRLSEAEWHNIVNAISIGLAETGHNPPSGIITRLEGAFHDYQLDSDGSTASTVEMVALILQIFTTFLDALA
jgi:hypothetical protein